MDCHNVSAPVVLESSTQSQQSLPAEQSSSSTAAVRVETATTRATHNAVKAEDLSVFVGARCLLANTELKIAEQPHAPQSLQKGICYGLVGVNGCGKSTLLNLIAEGGLPVPPNWDVFLVSQHLPVVKEHSAIEAVLTANVERERLLSEQAVLEDSLIDFADSGLQTFEEVNAKLLELQSQLSKWDGAEKEITQILLALGFRGSEQAGKHGSEPTIKTPMNELSGGWRMKVQLAKALWLQPRLLLLDEPTNHLDFHAVSWLQDRLEQYPHTAVVVSHDVGFLHSVCQEVIWMKDLKLESLPRDMVSQEDLLRMQRRKGLNFNFSIPEGNDAKNHGLSLHGVEFKYGGSCSSHHRLRVKKEVRFSGGSRSVLLGKNGSGKSTFLDLCVGKLKPTGGNVDRTPDLRIGHYSQLTEELDRNSIDTAASYLVRECPDELALRAGATRTTRLQSALGRTDQSSEKRASTSKKASAQQKRLMEIARGVLSHFGFEGDVAVTVPVDRLSGGQKALLKFAVLSLRPAHILFLDEPTNHLDAEACEALAKGLSEFKGGIVAVTHDELLIYRLIHCNWSASELLICREGTVWRERNFGAHCLNALKNEVHRAEEHDLQQGKQKEETPAQFQKEPKTTSATSKELPPWLQKRPRRMKENKDEAVAADPQLDPISAAPDSSSFQIDTNTHQADKVPSQERSQLAYNAENISHIYAEKMQQAEQVETLQNCTESILETWEDAAESDASTAVPEDPEEHKEDGISLVRAECTSLDKSSLKATNPKSGKRSRFRKDLVNLNKAVTKWLRQEEKGEVTHVQVLDFIRDSHVAQQLRASHGHEFDMDQFVHGALTHAKNRS